MPPRGHERRHTEWGSRAAGGPARLPCGTHRLQGSATGRPPLFDFRPRAPLSYTIACVFYFDDYVLDTTGISLLVPNAGQGWDLYLNGALLRSELHVRNDGSFGAERSLRDTIISIDKRNVVKGLNLLAFHIHGDPADPRTGLPRP